ncbi:MAG: hypothetical protein Q7S87_18050 [Agitococcus sp.]|nr:hypothetical protein [Agitococcus sp.]
MSHIAIVTNRLFGPHSLRVSNLKFTPGSNREITAEQVAEELTKSLARIEAGDFEVSIED